MIEINNFIDGNYYQPNSRKYTTGINPSTGKAFYSLPDSGKSDVERAILVAKRASSSWAETTTFERAKLLNRLGDLILENKKDLAKYESQDSGKPYYLSYETEIPRSARNFHFFASSITQFSSECHPSNKILNYTLREPLGVVVCISPWNLPLYLLTWKLAPAIACGNCVVAKPANVTSLSAHFLTKLFKEAGFPKGVINIVYGSGRKLSDSLCTHPDVKAVSFTGGTETGAEIVKKTAPIFKKHSLELGGKNAAMIFKDCDFEKAVSTTVRSSFTNQGQICLCTSRIFIESSVYASFKAEFIKKVKALSIGDPMDKNTDIGAVISSRQRDRVSAYIKNAERDGGTILTGGVEPFKCKDKNLKDGFFIEPTVIEGLTVDANINQEEVFGPVVTLIPFSDEEELVRMVNCSNFGLAATLWTKNLERAHQLANLVEVGIFWVNTWMCRDLRTPFGGLKNSGVGREGGLEVMRFFTEPKNVCISYQ